MPSDLYEAGFNESRVFQDLQAIVRTGFHRFNRSQIHAIADLAGFTLDADDRAVCSAVRKIIREQICNMPSEEWQDFAERLFGLTDDTVNASTHERELIAGEAFARPLQPSTVRARGGPREIVLMVLAENINRWAISHASASRFRF